MENWGLVIMDEDSMLIDNEDFSFKNKISIAYILSHEVF